MQTQVENRHSDIHRFYKMHSLLHLQAKLVSKIHLQQTETSYSTVNEHYKYHNSQIRHLFFHALLYIGITLNGSSCEHCQCYSHWTFTAWRCGSENLFSWIWPSPSGTSYDQLILTKWNSPKNAPCRLLVQHFVKISYVALLSKACGHNLNSRN